MKKIFFLILFLAPAFAFAQTKKAKRESTKKIEEGWDIVLPPGEIRPGKTTDLKNARAAVMTNWGKDTLLPARIVTRLINECTNPVVIKIGDTGGKISHPYLNEGQMQGGNHTGEPNAEDGQGHATHVAGIIAAQGFGLTYPLIQKGLVVWSPQKVLSNGGTGAWAWLANGLKKQLPNDMGLIGKGWGVVWNLSLGGGLPDTDTEAALKEGADAGVLYFCASGNTGKVGVNFPASSQNAIACASISKNFARSKFSTFGPQVHCAMPGDGIFSTYKGNSFAELSGTSMATPFLTACAAIALSKWGPQLQNLQKMRDYLKWCARDLEAPGKDDNTGWGIPFVEAILDKNPANMPIKPDPTPGIKRTATFVFGAQPFAWRENKKPDIVTHTATVEQIEIEWTSDKNALAAWFEAKAFIDAYFVGRVLVMGPNQDFLDVVAAVCSDLDNRVKGSGAPAKVNGLVFLGDGIRVRGR